MKDKVKELLVEAVDNWPIIAAAYFMGRAGDSPIDWGSAHIEGLLRLVGGV